MSMFEEVDSVQLFNACQNLGTLELVPAETLSIILFDLEYYELMKFEAVNTTWRRIISSKDLWKAAAERQGFSKLKSEDSRFELPLETQYFLDFKAWFVRLERLRLDLLRDITYSVTNLQSLELNKYNAACTAIANYASARDLLKLISTSMNRLDLRTLIYLQILFRKERWGYLFAKAYELLSKHSSISIAIKWWVMGNPTHYGVRSPDQEHSESTTLSDLATYAASCSYIRRRASPKPCNQPPSLDEQYGSPIIVWDLLCNGGQVLKPSMRWPCISIDEYQSKRVTAASYDKHNCIDQLYRSKYLGTA